MNAAILTPFFNSSLEAMYATKEGQIKDAIDILLVRIEKRFELTELMIGAAILDPSVQHLEKTLFIHDNYHLRDII